MLCLRPHFPALLALAFLLGLEARSESEFYRQFLAASTKKGGFLHDTSLVNTNNIGPTFTNAPVAFSKFANEGKLLGIQLGMTMSEVVAAWGLPRNLYTHCTIGPRFWYGPGSEWGDVSLFFRGDRLEIIRFYGDSAKSVVFDNGLTRATPLAEWEEVLGVKAVKDVYSVSISCRGKGTLARFYFRSAGQQEPKNFTRYFDFAEVRAEPLHEQTKTQAEPSTGPNGDPPKTAK